MNRILLLDDEVPDLEYGTPASAVYLNGDKGFLPTGRLEEETADTSATVLHPDQRIDVAGITAPPPRPTPWTAPWRRHLLLRRRHVHLVDLAHSRDRDRRHLR